MNYDARKVTYQEVTIFDIPLGFHHEAAGGKQCALDGADPLVPVAVAIHAVKVPQRGVRLLPQPVYGTVNIGLKIRRV